MKKTKLFAKTIVVLGVFCIFTVSAFSQRVFDSAPEEIDSDLVESLVQVNHDVELEEINKQQSLSNLGEYNVIEKPSSSVALAISSISGSNSTNIEYTSANQWIFTGISISGAPSNARVTSIEISWDTDSNYCSDIDWFIDKYTSGYGWWSSSTYTDMTATDDDWLDGYSESSHQSKTISSIPSGVSVNGTWYFNIADTYNDSNPDWNKGRIDSWNITIYYDEFTPYFFDARITNSTDNDSDDYMQSFDIEFDVDTNMDGNYYVVIYEDDPIGDDYLETSSTYSVSGNVTDYHGVSISCDEHNLSHGTSEFKLELYDADTDSLKQTWTASNDSSLGGVYTELSSEDVPPQPDLTPYQRSGWDDKLVISNQTGTTSSASLIYDDENIYVDYGCLNSGDGGAGHFRYGLYIDNVLRFYVDKTSLAAGSASYVLDSNIGSLSAGNHTFKIVCDYDDEVSESNESNNEYSRVFYITARPKPDLKGSTFAAPATLSPGQTYDVTISIDNSNAPTGSGFYADFYLSTDQTISTSDTKLSSVWYDVLPADICTINTDHPFTMPDNSDPVYSGGDGLYYLGMIIDSTDLVDESNENNNRNLGDGVDRDPANVVGITIPEIHIEPTSLTFTCGSVATISSEDATEEMTSKTFGRESQTHLRGLDKLIHFKSDTVHPGQTSSLDIIGINNNAKLNQFNQKIAMRKHILAQFKKLLSPDEIKSFEQNGINVLRYIPNYAYLLGIENVTNASEVMEQSDLLEWTWIPEAIFKQAPEFHNNEFTPTSRFSDDTILVYVRYFSDVEVSDILEAIKIVTGAEIQEFVFGNVISVRLPMESIDILSDLDEVEYVEPAPAPNTRTNATAAQRIHVDDLWVAPYNLDGTGINVGIWDEGSVDAHGDFGTRLTIQDGGATAQWHSTHVAGTVGGSGAGNANARGMADAVNLHSWDWGNDQNEMRNEAPTAGVVISNHSYGEVAGWDNCSGTCPWIDHGTGAFGNYNTVAANWDDIVADTDLIIFKSAGNDRNDGPDWPGGPRMDGPYDCISSYGNAKNIITVGATTDADGMTNFSSWGPADDGRIKPDLCANGHTLTSTSLGNTYTNASGTSMATPSTAGAGALLYELYESETGNVPTAATLKALMIHGCTDLAPTGPDYQFGWGLVNSTESADLIFNEDWQTSELTQTGSETTFSVTVGSATDNLKVTIVWTDPEGSPAATTALINDLDLVLEAPDDTIFLPWLLDGDNPDQDAVRGENHVDNVEQVVVDSPQTGVWTARVRGNAIPLGPQEFTIVAEGISNSESFTIFNDGTGTLAISDITKDNGSDWLNFSPMPPFDVNEGNFQVVTVTVDQTGLSPDSYSDRLLIYSNDSDESPYPGGVYVDLTVTGIPPVITQDPDDVTECEGSNATFNVSATGTSPLQYQWSKDGVPVGTDSSTLVLTNVQSSDDGVEIICTVTNSNGFDTSASAYLTVETDPSIVNITPPSSTICAGLPFTLCATANGSSPLTYRWFIDDAEVPSTTSSCETFTLASAGTYQVSVEVCNSCGCLTSSYMIITVCDKPVITQQPSNQTVTNGGIASFTVMGTGCGPMHYQWKKNGSSIGTDSQSLTLTQIQCSDNGSQITCDITNDCGVTTSNAATLAVDGCDPCDIIITQDPASQSVNEGGNVTFNVSASGTGPLQYRWTKNGSDVGGNMSSLTLTNVQLSDNGALIVCEVSNSCGSVASNPATLTVLIPSCDSARSFPSPVEPSSTTTITIDVNPDVSVQVYAVEDVPPVSWTVSNINESGTWDSVNEKVKWGLFFDNNARTLTYDITAPADANDCYPISGITSFDGLDQVVCGVDEICIDPNELPLCYAERSFGPNCYDEGLPTTVSIAVTSDVSVQVYAAEDTPPAGWTVSNINEGGAWDSVNEKVKWGLFFDNSPRTLTYDVTPPVGTTGCPPFYGIASFDGVDETICLDDTICKCVPPDPVVTTFDPNCYSPGLLVLVTIDVTPDTSVQVYAVEDAPPVGWAASNINEGGSWDDVNKKVKWGLFFDNNPRMLMYDTTPPSGETGEKTFSGTASFDGVDESFDRPISQCPCPTVGDFDNDCDVDGDDLRILVGNWLEGL